MSKVSEKLVKNRLVDHLEKCGLFSDFQYGFRSFQSTAVLLKVVSDRIPLDASKAFDRVGYAGLLHKLKSYGIQVCYLIFFLSFLRQHWVVLDGKSSQEYPANAGGYWGSTLGPTLFLLYINDFPDDVVCNTAIYADDTTLHAKCEQVSDMWQQLELASELESNL